MLSALPPSTQIHALSEALRIAGRREIDPLSRRLIQALRLWRDRRQRLIAPLRRIGEHIGLIVPPVDLVIVVVRGCERLEDDARREIRRLLPEDISVALRALATSDRVGDKLAAARMLAHVSCPPEIDALTPLFFDTTPEVSAAAGEGLARSLCADRTRTPLTRRRHELLATVLDRFDDLTSREALVCAVHAARRPAGRLRALLLDDGHPSHMAARAAVRNAHRSIDGADLVHALGFPGLAPAAIDRLMTLRTEDQWRDALSAAHLVRTSARWNVLSRVCDRKAPLPNVDMLRVLDETSRRSLVMWLDPIGREADGALTDELVADQSSSVRASLTCRLARSARPDESIGAALHRLAEDPNEPIARSAALVLSDDEGEDGLRTLRELAGSPHRSVRRFVEHARSVRDPLHRLEVSDPLCNRVAIARWLANDRDGAIGVMRETLLAGDADQRIRVVAIARRLGILDEFELELLSLASHENRRLISAAALALGWLNSGTSIDALGVFVNHSDERVRANAVEALARREPLADPIDASLDAEVARQRANAIRGRLRLVEPKLRTDAANHLERMLEDERIEHRRSALWVAQRLGSPAHARIVTRLGASDPDERIRERARMCGRRLLAGMRISLADQRARRQRGRRMTEREAAP